MILQINEIQFRDFYASCLTQLPQVGEDLIRKKNLVMVLPARNPGVEQCIYIHIYIYT